MQSSKQNLLPGQALLPKGTRPPDPSGHPQHQVQVQAQLLAHTAQQHGESVHS